MNIPTKPSTSRARQEMDAHLRRIANALALMEQFLPLRRRMLSAGDSVYHTGEHFANLHVIHSGFFKLVAVSADGREQVVALHFKGDWLGFDGIANGQHGCDAVAIDIGEVWTICYNTFLRACAEHPTLLNVLHTAMSQEMARDHDSMVSLCTLSADERVADFLARWVGSLERRGLRTDQMTLCLTRAEIGSYLGMTLESVSRAFSRLAREKLICFTDHGRRDLQIPDMAALSAFVHGSLSTAAVP